MTKKKKIIIVVSIVIIVLIAYLVFGGKDKVEYITSEVIRSQILQTVSEVGTVKASSEIDLSFLNTGKVAKMLVKIGDKVKQGQILAELDYSGLSINGQEAQANLEVNQANLAKLLAGATAEEIAVSQANVNKTKSAYDAAVKELEKIQNSETENIAQAEKTLNDLKLSTINDITAYEQAVAVAKTTLDNTKSTYQRSIDNKQAVALTTIEDKLSVADTALDTINTVITDDDAENLLSVTNITYLVNTKNNHNQAAEALSTANSALMAAKQNKTNNNINQALDDSLSALNKTFSALNSCYNALESSIISSSFTQAELDAFKAGIDTELTNISSAISLTQTAQQNLADAMLSYDTNVASAEEDVVKAQASLSDALIDAQNALNTARLSAEQNITAAQNKADSAWEAWQVGQVELAQIKAPARKQDILLNRAKVKQAQATLNSIKNQIEDSIIKAPIDGTITKINYEIGEQTSAAEPSVSMLGENHFEIEVDISEADIAKIKKDNPAGVTLDAFGDEIIFTGKVYFIEPAETVIQDVIYYKVKIDFDPAEQAVKSGMTANVVLTTAQKDDVLIIPSRTVVERNGGDKIVRVLTRGQVKEVPVVLGLRGDGGVVEVLSGVKEGEKIVTFVKEKK